MVLKDQIPGQVPEDVKPLIKRWELDTQVLMEAVLLCVRNEWVGGCNSLLHHIDSLLYAGCDLVYGGKGSLENVYKAISNQYKIANGVLSDKKEKKLKLLPDGVRDSELLSWFQSIIESAPFSEYSPLAQFALAESYQNDKKISLAIASYQKLVDKYPNHKLSSEAQYRIGDIARKQINLGSRDSANISIENPNTMVMDVFKIATPTVE